MKGQRTRRTSEIVVGLSTISSPIQVPTSQTGSLIVSIRHLKGWALRNLPTQSKVRTILLSERELMTAEEFVGKVETWSLLMNSEYETT